MTSAAALDLTTLFAVILFGFGNNRIPRFVLSILKTHQYTPSLGPSLFHKEADNRFPGSIAPHIARSPFDHSCEWGSKRGGRGGLGTRQTTRREERATVQGPVKQRTLRQEEMEKPTLRHAAKDERVSAHAPPENPQRGCTSHRGAGGLASHGSTPDGSDPCSQCSGGQPGSSVVEH